MSNVDTARGPDPIIEEIERNHLFQYSKGQVMEAKYVSEGLKDELKSWLLPGVAHGPIFITAPPGAGKSTFVLNELADHAKAPHNPSAQFHSKAGDTPETLPSKNILLLSNRWALSLQQKMILEKRNGEQIHGSRIIEGLLQFDNILVTTYQNVLDKLDVIKSQGALGFVVFDEAHFFCSDSTFNAETSRILQTLLDKFRNVCRIYITATPEEVKPIIAFEEYRIHRMRLGSADNHESISALSQPPQIIEYTFSANYSSRIQLHFFHDENNQDKNPWMDIVAAIKNDESDNKWLLFVSRKEIGNQIQKSLGPSLSEYIDSPSQEEKSEELLAMTRRGRFEKKVLITTNFLYNGISFHDPHLKNIVMDYCDKISIIQALGRKRLELNEGEKVDLYIKVQSEKLLDGYRRNVASQYTLSQEFRENPSRFLTSRWSRLRKDQLQMFAPIGYDPYWIGGVLENELKKVQMQIAEIRKDGLPKGSIEQKLYQQAEYIAGILNQYNATDPGWVKWYTDERDAIARSIHTEEKNMVCFIMSDYAPYHLSQQLGNYERLLDLIAGDDKQGFQEEVCRWLGLEYDTSMEFANPQWENQTKANFEAVKIRVLACIEKYVSQSPMDRETIGNFAGELIKIVNDAGLKKEIGIRGDKERTKADINAILKYFDSDYTCEKGDSVSNTWTLVRKDLE